MMRLAVVLLLLIPALTPVAQACTPTSCQPDPEPIIEVICDGDVCVDDPKAVICRLLGYPAQGGSCLHGMWCIVKEIGLQRPVC